jgi:hypothetical protein
MVVPEPNLTLTLEHVAGCGAVLSTEQQVCGATMQFLYVCDVHRTACRQR